MTIERRGLMCVLSSPSGAGKTTIAKYLLDHDNNLKMSVSMTTRKRRPGEVSGKDYLFTQEEDFNKAIADDEFLEWAKVFDNYYGTPKAYVEQQLSHGQDVLFDIDWQGTQQLAQQARGDLVSIFILPPSYSELERRLHQRAQDPLDVIHKRMNKAAEEISHWAEYDYVVINENLTQTVDEVAAILSAERHKRKRLIGLSQFVKKIIQKQ